MWPYFGKASLNADDFFPWHLYSLCFVCRQSLSCMRICFSTTAKGFSLTPLTFTTLKQTAYTTDHIFFYPFFSCHFLFTVRENKIIHNFQIFSCIFPSFLLLSLTIVEGDFSPTSNYVRCYSLSSTSSISQLSNSHSHQIYVQVGETHLHSPHKFSLSIFF